MSLHIFNDIEQGSDAWHDLRRGLVTASTVGQLVTISAPDVLTVQCPTCRGGIGHPCFSMSNKTPTPIKTIHEARTAKASTRPPVYGPADNEGSRNLTALLVAERLTGCTDPTWQSDDMFRGVVSEPVARDIYSGHFHQAEEVGFMVREEDDWKLGYSPDGVVGTDGLLEIKSPRAKTHLKTILADEVPAQYVAQCQAGLLVTGRDWIDFVSYVGGMPLFRKRVHPDPKWHTAITAACQQFEKTAADMVAAYEQATTGMPATERIDNELGLVF